MIPASDSPPSWYAAGPRSTCLRRSVTPLFKTLALFHVFLPVLLLWLIYRLGDDARALPAVRIAFRTGPGIKTRCCSVLIAASPAMLGVPPAVRA